MLRFLGSQGKITPALACRRSFWWGYKPNRPVVNFGRMPVHHLEKLLPSVKLHEVVPCIYHMVNKGTKMAPRLLTPYIHKVKEHFLEMDGQYLFELFCISRYVPYSSTFWVDLCAMGDECNDFDTKQIAVIFNVLAYHGNRGMEEMKKEERNLLRRLRSLSKAFWRKFNAQSIATLLDGMAVLELHDRQLVRKMCLRLKIKMEDITPQELGLTLNALARIHGFLGGDRVLESTADLLCSESLLKVPRFHAPAIANVLSWVVRSKSDHKKLVQRMCAHAQNIHDTFEPSEIGATLAALAKLGVVDDYLVRKLIQVAAEKIEKFKPRAIATTLVALSKLDVNSTELVRKLCVEIPGKIEDFNSLDIANSLVGLARMNVEEPTVIAVLYSEAVVQNGGVD